MFFEVAQLVQEQGEMVRSFSGDMSFACPHFERLNPISDRQHRRERGSGGGRRGSGKGTLGQGQTASGQSAKDEDHSRHRAHYCHTHRHPRRPGLDRIDMII